MHALMTNYTNEAASKMKKMREIIAGTLSGSIGKMHQVQSAAEDLTQA